MSTALQETIDKLGKAFKEFQDANDERWKQLKDKGVADADVVAKVERSNAAIDRFEKQIETIQAQTRELETQSARMAAIVPSKNDREEKLATDTQRFFSMQRDVPLHEISVTAELITKYKDYVAGFWAWARRGDKSIGPEITNALSVGSNPDGGYTVPPDTTGRIAKLVFETSPLRGYANIQTTGSDALEGFYDLDEVSSGWVGEMTVRPETQAAQIGGWRIPVHEQYAMPSASQKSIDDSQWDIESWLIGKIASKLARKENTGFVLGSGSTQPRGFMTYPAAVPSKAAFAAVEQQGTGVSGDFAATPNGADVFIDTLAKLKEAYLGAGCAWAMNRRTKAKARKLKDSQGRYILIPDLQNPLSTAIEGYPLIGFEDMADVSANSLSIAFANWREAYQIVDRLQISVLRDPFTAKPKVLFYSTKRVGGDVVNFEAIKMVKFA